MFKGVSFGLCLVVVLFFCTCDRTPLYVPPHSYEHGMNVATWQKEGYNPDKLASSLEKLAECGGDAVAFVPTWFMENPGSSTIHRTDLTVDDTLLSGAVLIAEDLGFKVMLKPHVDVETGEWRGFISPGDADSWFSSYLGMILHYADICESCNVERLCIGTELTSMSGMPHWKPLIDSVRAHFRGELTFAADWNGINKVKFWDELDYAGIDFYSPLASREGEGPEVYLENISDWFDRLDDFASSINKPMIVTEIGFRSTRKAALEPWEWQENAPVDEAVQADCYRSVLESFPQKSWLAGIYFWMWEDNVDSISATGYSPRGKSAEQILREYWR